MVPLVATMTEARLMGVIRATVYRAPQTIWEGTGQVQWPWVALPIRDYYDMNHKQGVELAMETGTVSYLPLLGRLLAEWEWLRRLVL